MMNKFPSTLYERLQSDDENDNIDEDLPPQVHITAPGGEGNGRTGQNFEHFVILMYIN